VQDLQREAEDQFRETEQVLEARIAETEAKLANMQSSENPGGTAILSEEQTQAIAEFRRELVATRKELRDVQLALRKDIEGLGSQLAFLNIGLVPLLIGCIAILVSWVRRQRRRRAHAAG